MTWRALDLFCGAAGGWSLGLHRSGFTTVAACEIDPWRRAVFAQNNPGVLLYDDIRALNADRLLRDLRFLPSIIAGSPPCQDASTANTQGRGVDGERTGLFFDAVRLVREVRPRWALFENVPGLRTRGYDRIHDALEQAGYTVWPLVVGAVHAGAPHLRKRVWIIAADMSRIGRGPGRPRRSDTGNTWQSEQALHNADAAPMLGSALARREPDGTATRAVADADKARRAGGQLEPGLRETEVAGDRRGFLEAWPDWNGGPPDLGRMDDGLSAALASRRGVGRACLAAYGDAVVPQITEAIGRVVMALEFGIRSGRIPPGGV